MTERRIDLTESQLRKLVRTVWDEAFSDGDHNAIIRSQDGFLHAQDAGEAWSASLSCKVVDELIELEQEQTNVS